MMTMIRFRQSALVERRGLLVAFGSETCLCLYYQEPFLPREIFLARYSRNGSTPSTLIQSR